MISEYKQLFEGMLKEVLGIEGIDSDKAVNVASILVQEYGKNKRTEILREARSNGHSDQVNDQKVTEKQLKFLKQLKVEVPEGTTKRQASEMIAEAVNHSESNA